MTPWLQDPDVTLYHGDNLDVLRQLPDRSVHMCATSPPFYGLRDYGTGLWEGGDPDCDHKAPSRFDYATSDKQLSNAGSEQHSTFRDVCGRCGARRVDQQIGLEDTPDQWVERLVAVFREVRRVLRDDGTLWVEIGDSYAAGKTGRGDAGREGEDGFNGGGAVAEFVQQRTPPAGTKPKDLLGQPWLLAFALRADGWYLRSEIIWARPNPMPESVTDRPTKSHSTVFLLSKQPRYFYDADAIRDASTDKQGRVIPDGHEATWVQQFNGDKPTGRLADDGGKFYGAPANGANARSVWQIPTQPTPFAHFATWPEALVRRMILAGTSERGCCPECGAPWTRDTESALVPGPNIRISPDRFRADLEKSGGIGGVSQASNRVRDGHVPSMVKQVTTLGWSPGCSCIDDRLELDEPDFLAAIPFPTPVPCTVLDPFAGSATTNLVARNHGRHSIGIELNADYLKIAAKRLQQLSLLST